MTRKIMGEKLKNLGSFFAVPILMLAAVYIVLAAVGNVGEKQKEQELKQMQDTVKRAVLNCYSIEGSYPDSVEYVERHYGLQINHDRYDVFYEIFADNIMPEITVVAKDDSFWEQN